MIGGTDVVMAAGGNPEDLDVCARALLRIWPRAVFEDAKTGRMFDYQSLPLGQIRELFVYRDKSTALAWDAGGADHTLKNTMVHFLLSDDAVTAVVDDPTDPELGSCLQSAEKSLGMDILHMPASHTGIRPYYLEEALT